MNMRQLETFFWVAKLGTFTAAAERLNATQSTVSLRIQELERDLGALLFDRSQRTARLSAKGRALLPYADQILRLTGEIRDSVARAGEIEGTLRVGVAEVISVTWLPRLVKEIHDRYPRITLELDEALTHDLVQRFRAGSLDLIMAPGRAEGFGRSVPLGRVPFAWMASPELALPKQTRMKPADLQNWPIIALSRESYHHASVEEWFRSGGATCRRIDTCKSLNVAASLAAAGLGLTLLPPRCYGGEIASGRLRIVETTPPFQPVEFTATPATDAIQPLARRIAALAAEISDFDRTDEPGDAPAPKQVGGERRSR